MNDNNVVFIVGYSLMTGGAEKKLIETADYLIGENLDVKILLFNPNISLAVPPEISNRIKVLGDNVNIKTIIKLDYIIRHDQPKLVMGFLGHVNVVLGILKKRHPNISFIGRENATYREFFLEKGLIHGKLLKICYKKYLKKLDKIIFQSSYARKEAREMFGIQKKQSVVISNPLGTLKRREPRPMKTIKLLSVGRLVKVKNQIDMITVLQKLPSNFELIFLGDGEEKQSLINYSKELKLENRVIFEGEVKNVEKYYQNCDFLLLTSLRETFPNVALEATANRLPVITYDIPGGIREIVKNNINGFIVPWGDINEMANTIKNSVKFTHRVPQNLLTEDEYFNSMMKLILEEMERYNR